MNIQCYYLPNNKILQSMPNSDTGKKNRLKHRELDDYHSDVA